MKKLSAVELALRVLGTRDEAAEVLGVSTRTISRWREAGYVSRRREAKALSAAVVALVPSVTVEALLSVDR